MSQIAKENVGYSADIEMWMDCGDLGRVDLHQASTTFVIAREARDLPPCDAVIVLVVDGKTYTRPVSLPGGMSQDDPEAVVLSRDDVSPF